MPGIKDKIVVITGASSERIRERAAEQARASKCGAWNLEMRNGSN